MIRFLLHRFREASGPFKQTRLIAGDLAEEILDLAEHYLSRRDMGDEQACAADPSSTPTTKNEENHPPDPVPAAKKAKRTEKGDGIASAETPKTTEPRRTLEVPPELGKVLDVPQNRKKQKFKVLAILWDARRRDLGPLSAKEVSEHGVKLGLAIRHENVRKVIRMRLDKLVEIRTEQVGSSSIYRYRLSDEGEDAFRSDYLA